MGTKLETASRRLLLCLGPVCRARGAGRLHRLAQRQAPADVALLRVACLGACGHAPVAVLYPAASWYPEVAPATLRAVWEQERGRGESPTDA